MREVAPSGPGNERQAGKLAGSTRQNLEWQRLVGLARISNSLYSSYNR